MRPIVARRWRPGVVATSVFALSMVLSACGGAASPATIEANQTYLDQVHSEASDISTYRSDTQLIGLAHAACDGFSGGATYQQLADRMTVAATSPLPSEDLGVVIDAGVQIFCPRYQHLIG